MMLIPTSRSPVSDNNVRRSVSPTRPDPFGPPLDRAWNRTTLSATLNLPLGTGRDRRHKGAGRAQL